MTVELHPLTHVAGAATYSRAHSPAHSYSTPACSRTRRGTRALLAFTSAVSTTLAACTAGGAGTTGTTSSAMNEATQAVASPSTTSQPSPAEATAPEQLKVEILATHPFDDTSFTQGLEVDGDGTSLLVSTGWEGSSRIYRTTVDGQESHSHDIDPSYFGEGMTRTRDGSTVWQLTWKNGVAIKRDAQTLEQIDTATYSGEGWGLCAFDDALYFSDGSSTLRVLDPKTFAQRSTIEVTSQGNPVDALNELECVPAAESPTGGDTVYANRFLSTDIMRIDAATGVVNGIVDASTVPNNALPDVNNVLNGIAHIPGTTDQFYLTGKRWPDLYEVSISPAGA